MLNTPIGGLFISRQIALDRGASEDEALTSGLVGYVAPMAGLVLAATTEPVVAVPPRQRPRDEPDDAGVSKAVAQLSAEVTKRVDEIRRGKTDDAASETRKALDALAKRIKECSSGLSDGKASAKESKAAGKEGKTTAQKAHETPAAAPAGGG